MIKVGFLGGITEFGNNCCFIEFKNDIIIIDCGFKFFNKNEIGIRYEIPDFSYLINNKNKIKGVIVTHGHLDHIGGIPYLLKEIKCNIYCTSFTGHLISKQIRNDKKYNNYIKIIGKENFSLGNFTIEPFSVNHSIIDSVGFIVHTPIKDNTKLFFCGDLNLDESPYIGKTKYFNFVKKYKDVPKVLFLDSTNAVTKGSNVSETKVYKNLEKIIINNLTTKKIFFTTFSSQIQRQIIIFDLAIKYKRKILVIGRSIFENLKYLFNLKEYKKYQEYIKFSEDNFNNNEKYLILCTGSQGEENSTIEKIVQKRIKKINIQNKDLFIFSSSIIPGNEQKIFNIWNNIYSQGGEVISYRDSDIHSSGHGKVEEIKKIIDLIKPDYFIPIHGEYRNLYHNKKIAENKNIKSENIHIFRKGDIFNISEKLDKKITFECNINVEKIIFDKNNCIIEDHTIEERKKIAENGILIISLPKQKNSNEIKIKAIGINNFDSNEESLLKEKIFYNLNNKENKINQLVGFFFKEKNLSKPTIYIM